MKSGWICAVAAAAVFAADRAAKNKAKQLQPGEEKPMLGGRVIFRRSRNNGAMMNMGDRNPVLVRRVSAVLTAGLIPCCAAVLAGHGSVLKKTGFSLLTAGACGNTLDRLSENYVTDYLSFNAGDGKLKNTVFNLADFAIIGGAGMAVIDSFRK
jgi:signal peptidase II